MRRRRRASLRTAGLWLAASLGIGVVGGVVPMAGVGGAPRGAEAEGPRPGRTPVPVPHDIPSDVLVRALVHASGGVLSLVVRVPLTSMRDVEFPTRGPGYVDVEAVTPLLVEQASLWIAGYVSLYEEFERLPGPVVVGARISLPSDRSLHTHALGRAHVLEDPPLPADVDLVLEQAMLDVVLEAPIRSDSARFSIEPQWVHLGVRTTTVVRFVTQTGDERVFQFQGNPGRVLLDPRWHQSFLRFVALGFLHILDGIDHLLFLLCLVVPLRRLWPLVSVVTAFTAAHSITLAASVLGLVPRALWFPPLIETMIAASILFMAMENMLGTKLERRWMWSFGFGLVHGFGFSFQLRESLQFGGQHLWTSLLGFNLGVEVGQLMVLVVLVPALALLFSRVTSARVGCIALSAVVAHASWHWMAERWSTLRAFEFGLPALDVQTGAGLLRWLLLLLVATGVGWALHEVYARVATRFGGSSDGSDSPASQGIRDKTSPQEPSE